MRPQKQPNKYSCLVTCAAMLLDLKVKDCFKILGHEGKIRINGRYLGFTIPEIQYLAMRESKIFLETSSLYEDDSGSIVCEVDWTETLMTTQGIVRYSTVEGHLHAIVYDGVDQIIINPKDGKIRDMPDELEVHDFLPLLDITQEIGLPRCTIGKVNSPSVLN